MIINKIADPDVAQCPCARALAVKISELRHLSKVIRAVGTGEWIFRGHESADWHLSSSLEREFADIVPKSSNPIVNNAVRANSSNQFGLSDELYAIDTFKRLSQGLMTPVETEVEWLAAMQHYGTPTRLVDFTRSIYVALYFAFKNRRKKARRAIYAVRFKDLIHNATIRDDLVNVLLERYEPEGKNKSINFEKYRKHVQTGYYKNQLELQKTLIELSSRCIRKELQCEESGIIPVHVPGANERLVAQSGLFLLPRNFKSFECNLSASLGVAEGETFSPSQKIVNVDEHGVTSRLRNASILKFVFDEDKLSNDAIWNMLDQANVSALNLFPGLEGVASSIRYGEPLFRGN